MGNSTNSNVATAVTSQIYNDIGNGIVTSNNGPGANSVLLGDPDVSSTSAGVCGDASEVRSEGCASDEGDAEDGESGSEWSDDVATPDGADISDPPPLQGRFIRLTDYLPELQSEMPDLTLSNLANFFGTCKVIYFICFFFC